MFPSLDLHYLFLIVLYRNMVHLYKLFFQPLMINIKPARWYCRLPLEDIFIGILPSYFIIQFFSMGRKHRLFGIIQSSTSLFNLIIWSNLLPWCYWFIWRWANNIGWHDYFMLGVLQQTYWLQTQVKYLIVQS